MSYYAFFDLDETIMSCKSMLKLMEFYYGKEDIQRGVSENGYHELIQRIEYFKNNNKDRNSLNKYFYTNFKGIKKDVMESVCKEWFKKEGIHMFNKSVVNELKKHQKRGATVMIVSGSFEECVLPIANYLNVNNIVCNRLASFEGEYTGALLNDPTIGVGKKQGILDSIETNQNVFHGSYAYGDHISDLPMMLLAENPVVVGHDPELLMYGVCNGWKVLSI